jgi:hypothetical protein
MNLKGKKADDVETWYKKPNVEMQMKELYNTGMVEIYNHQYMWDNRQYPKVHQAFTDVLGTEKLWVTIDRVNLNFPIRPGFEYKGFIHWDYDPDTKPQNVQGVLALADQTDETMGGFQCIPELFRTYDTWKLTQPEDRDHYWVTSEAEAGFEVGQVHPRRDDQELIGLWPTRSVILWHRRWAVLCGSTLNGGRVIDRRYGVARTGTSGTLSTHVGAS